MNNRLKGTMAKDKDKWGKLGEAGARRMAEAWGKTIALEAWGGMYAILKAWRKVGSVAVENGATQAQSEVMARNFLIQCSRELSIITNAILADKEPDND